MATVVLLATAQVWSSWLASRRAAQLAEQLRHVPAGQLANEKLRQEMIEVRLKNEEASSFPFTLVRNLSVGIALLAALSGSWIAFHQYLQVRTRERLDRAALDLSTLWEGISSPDQNRRAGSLAGLADFMTPDKQEFHDRIISALALVGRIRNNTSVVSRTLTPLVEWALRSHTASARQVSWQGLDLFRLNLSGCRLARFDFRDSLLPECDFRGTDLANARFDAASLVGAKFDDATLTGANLAYADLARASMRKASLRDADLRNIRLLDLDLDGADLRGAVFAPHATDWRLARNWRTALMDEPLRERLIAQYGPVMTGVRVAMLMWEYPPLVSGGGWTAAYHILINLRRRGAHVTVFVPLPASVIDRKLFGNEIEVIGVGDEKDVRSLSEHSAYTVAAPGYWEARDLGPGKQYGYASRPLLAQVDAFQLHVLRAMDERRLAFDVIHAHDWLTFPAADTLSQSSGKPWIAHFHSLEADRQPGHENRHVTKVEAQACQGASHVVAVSLHTRDRLQALYTATTERVLVVPNCLSETNAATYDLGAFDTRRVVFLGRLTRQKGIDLFVEIARRSAAGGVRKDFRIYGDGEEADWVRSHISYHRRHVPPPVVVPPRSEEDLRHGVAVNFAHLAALLENDLILPMGDAESQTVWKQIARRGFTATALDRSRHFRHYRYTHHIAVMNVGDGLTAEYLADVPSLRKATVSDVPFATLKGVLPWERRTEAFDGASVVIVPSRFEPFGMVVLEAMRHGVPVMYPRHAGVAEVVRAGIPFDPENADEAAAAIESLVTDNARWHSIVDEQLDAIAGYQTRGYETLLQELWSSVSGSARPRP